MFLGGLVACILDNTVKGKSENFSSVQRACKRAWRIAHYSERIHFRVEEGAALFVFIFVSLLDQGQENILFLLEKNFH